MRFHYKLCLLSFAGLLLTLPAFAQPGAIEGYVNDENNKPVANAVIGFDRVDYKKHEEIKTDKSGHFQMVGIINGDYTMTVTVDGVQRDSRPTHVSPGVGNTRPEYFKLKTVAAMKADEAKNMSSSDKKAAEENAAKQKEASEIARKALMDAYGAGKTALENKQYDEAIDSLTKATVADPKQAAVWATLADAYMGRSLKSGSDKASDQTKAAEAFQKAIELKPGEAGSYNNYALALAQSGRMDEAKVNLAKAIEIDPPGAGKYYYNLAALLLNTGQNDSAVEQFKKSIDADPNYADAYFQYGVALAGKSTVDAAGKMVAPPGTVEALQKYLSLKADGAHAQEAKDMITALAGSLQLNYKDPNAKPASNTKKK